MSVANQYLVEKLVDIEGDDAEFIPFAVMVGAKLMSELIEEVRLLRKALEASGRGDT